MEPAASGELWQWESLVDQIFPSPPSLKEHGNFPICLLPSLIVFGLLKFCRLRVSEQEEEEGLDVGEHGVASYPNFQPAVDL